ncbi:hypothetical protein JCM19992_13440 [Thermostilla marina]
MRFAGISIHRIPSAFWRVVWTFAGCALVLAASGCGLIAKYRPYVDESERQFLPPDFEHPAARVERLEKAVASKPDEAEKRRIAAEIARFFQESDDPSIRQDLTKLAAKLVGPDTVQVLRTAARDPDPRVRMAAAEALKDLPIPEATPLLVQLAENDPDSDVRHTAIAALGKRNDPAALQALGSQLKTRDPATQYLAMKSLRQVTGENFGYDARQWLAYLENRSGTPNSGQMIATRPVEPSR